MFNRIILRGTSGVLKGRRFVLEDGADYTLGRARDCSCVLEDPFRLISRRHCRIEVHAPSVRIQDLSSRNGTLVNGVNIGHREQPPACEPLPQDGNEEHPLGDGDRVRIAGYEFQVEFDPPPPCAAAEARDQNKLWACDCGSW
jgi:pSer/pThr/pTyr-binding forkhead associated (FHA) protein